MPGYRTQETPIYAVYPSPNPSAKTRTFIAFLVARFGHSRDSDHAGMNGNSKAGVVLDVLDTKAAPPKESKAS
jgi:hypothetical protein